MEVTRKGATPDRDFMADGMVRGFKEDNEATREFRTMQEISTLVGEAGYGPEEKWAATLNWKEKGQLPW